MTRGRENETLARLREFQNKVKRIQSFKKTEEDDSSEDDHWMSNTLRFHVDSQRAFDVNKAQAYA
jgi:hypothetical protein